MEESTPARKRNFKLLRSGKEKKSSTGKKEAQKNPTADEAVEDLESKRPSETPKTSEVAELSSGARQVGDGKVKKKKKIHMRHFSFGGKFHTKHKSKDVNVADRGEMADSPECVAPEIAGQIAKKTPSADDAKPEERRAEVEEESGRNGAEFFVQDQDQNSAATDDDQNSQPGQNNQSEGEKIGNQAGESEFQMEKERAMEIPCSPKETTSKEGEGNEESVSTTVEVVTPHAVTSAPLASEDASPQNDVNAQQDKGPTAKEESSLPISAVYQALLSVKTLVYGGKLSVGVGSVSGVPYEICQMTVNTGRAKLSHVLGFVLEQAEHSTRHVLGYFVKILIQKYPHCFQVTTNGKRKRSKATEKKVSHE